jgi:peptidylprolyl isomerase
VSPRIAIHRVGALLLAVTVVAGCAGSPSDETSTPSKPTTDLAAVKVTGEAGAKPVIVVPKPFSAVKTTRRVIIPGKGPLATPGQTISVDYLGVNGTDGKEFDSSFGTTNRTAFTLDDKQTMRGLVDGLSGVNVGSRVLIAIPPADAYGTKGEPEAGIGPTDTLLLVVDVKAASTVLKRASGTAVAPKKGLPKVTLDKSTGQPHIVVPKGKAPDKLIVRTLIEGKGPKVAKGQTIVVHYTGVIWDGGKQFDSSWAKNSPATFQIGTGHVIAGWDQGLVGKRVGSQVLLVLPPDKGYGAQGQPSAGIKGTDTLVFVVDILDVAA